jgi:hypothetical protein
LSLKKVQKPPSLDKGRGQMIIIFGCDMMPKKFIIDLKPKSIEYNFEKT